MRVSHFANRQKCQEGIDKVSESAVDGDEGDADGGDSVG